MVSNQSLTRPGGMSMQLLREAKNSLTLAATAGRLDPKRFYSAAYTQLHTNDDIRSKCDPRSILFALQKCANAGLYPDGDEAYLVPFGTKCVFIAGYKGLIKRFAELPTAADLPVQVDEVREKDYFEYRLGDEPYVKHVYGEGSAETRGEVIQFYCIFNFRDGSKLVKVMSFSDVDAYRQFSKVKTESKQFWNHPEWEVRKWMYYKTIIRQASKLLPLAADLRTKMELEDRIERGEKVHDKELEAIGILESEEEDIGFAEPQAIDEDKSKGLPHWQGGAIVDGEMSHEEADKELAEEDKRGTRKK